MRDESCAASQHRCRDVWHERQQAFRRRDVVGDSLRTVDRFGDALVEKAMRDSGFEDAGYASGMQPCRVYDEGSAQCLLRGPTAYDRGRVAFDMRIQSDAATGWVDVGVRADGTYGIEVVLVAR